VDLLKSTHNDNIVFFTNYEAVLATVFYTKNKQHVLGAIGDMSELISVILTVPSHSESRFLWWSGRPESDDFLVKVY
jgi:hypothetical protein